MRRKKRKNSSVVPDGKLTADENGICENVFVAATGAGEDVAEENPSILFFGWPELKEETISVMDPVVFSRQEAQSPAEGNGGITISGNPAYTTKRPESERRYSGSEFSEATLKPARNEYEMLNASFVIPSDLEELSTHYFSTTSMLSSGPGSSDGNPSPANFVPVAADFRTSGNKNHFHQSESVRAKSFVKREPLSPETNGGVSQPDFSMDLESGDDAASFRNTGSDDPEQLESFSPEEILSRARSRKGRALTREETDVIRRLATLQWGTAAPEEEFRQEYPSLQGSSVIARGNFAGNADPPETDQLNREIVSYARKQSEQLTRIVDLLDTLRE